MPMTSSELQQKVAALRVSESEARQQALHRLGREQASQEAMDAELARTISDIEVESPRGMVSMGGGPSTPRGGTPPKPVVLSAAQSVKSDLEQLRTSSGDEKIKKLKACHTPAPASECPQLPSSCQPVPQARAR